MHLFNLLHSLMKTITSFTVLIAILILSLILGIGCKKDVNETNSNNPKIPVVSTNEITDVTQVTAITGGAITDDGGATVTVRGVCWSTNETPTIEDNKTEDGAGAGSFTSLIEGLAPETNYFVRAYATNSKGTGYGMAMSFKTLEAVLPVLTTRPFENITGTSATSGGEITQDGFAEIIARGVVWNTSGQPTLENNEGMSNDGTGNGEFVSQITGLQPYSFYYVRAYATNKAGTSYGNSLSLSTLNNLPILTTKVVSILTSSTARCGGNITSDGFSDILSRGVVWSSSGMPSIENNVGITNDGTGLGEFDSQITGLLPSSDYIVRSYATNSSGVSYGSHESFTTLSSKPILSTSPVSEITFLSAVSGGNISYEGDAPVTARGVVWSINPDPTLDNYYTVDGYGGGSFSSTLSGLHPNTSYYLRAYATNIIGTSYGEVVTFITALAPLAPCPNFPTVTDIDGNVYNTVLIGTQCWMAENLKTTKYLNGTSIENPTGNSDWQNNTSGAYAWYDNDISWKDIYGALYNWHAVNNAYGLCPEGWHVPSDDEWTQLVDYIVVEGYPNETNNPNAAGNALKSCRQVNSPLNGACNTSEHPRWNLNNNNYGFDAFGFAALPASFRMEHIGFGSIGGSASWWTSTENSSMNSWSRDLGSSFSAIGGSNVVKSSGFSVRCLKDN